MTIDDMNIHLMASKNLEYRARVKNRFHALAHFLNIQGYSEVDLVAQLEIQGDHFKLESEYLNEKGMAWITSKYDKWLKKIGRANTSYDFDKYIESLNMV